MWGVMPAALGRIRARQDTRPVQSWAALCSLHLPNNYRCSTAHQCRPPSFSSVYPAARSLLQVVTRVGTESTILRKRREGCGW